MRGPPTRAPLTICGRPYHDGFDWLSPTWLVGKGSSSSPTPTTPPSAPSIDRSWVNVLPSVYHDFYGTTHVAPELMGLTLLESMASGTPAICSRVGAMPEFVRDGETGFVFDPLDELTARASTLARPGPRRADGPPWPRGRPGSV